jgi:hypothetical protein
VTPLRSQKQCQQVSAEDQARGEGDDHHRDVIEHARAIGTAVEDDRGGKEEQANRECDTRLDQAHAPTTRAKAEINCFSLPIFAHGSDISAASRSAEFATIKAFGSAILLDFLANAQRQCDGSGATRAGICSDSVP